MPARSRADEQQNEPGKNAHGARRLPRGTTALVTRRSGRTLRFEVVNPIAELPMARVLRVLRTASARILPWIEKNRRRRSKKF